MKKRFIIIFLLLHYFLHAEIGYLAETYRLSNNNTYESIGSCFLNPSGLWKIEVPEIAVSYNILYPNLNDKTKFINNTIVLTNRLFKGGFGIGINQFGIENWYIKDKFVFSYGQKIKIKEKENLKLGLKFIYEKENYTLDEYMEQSEIFSTGTENSWFSFSLGSIYYINESNIIGVSIENVNQPNIGLKTEEKLPIEINLGYKFSPNGKMKLYPQFKFDNSVKSDYTTGLGFEYDFYIFKKIKFSPSINISFGSRNYSRSILGLLIQTSQIGFSYCYSLDFGNKPQAGGQHYVSLNYKFLPMEVMDEKISKKEYIKLLTEKKELEQQLEQIKKYTIKQTTLPGQPKETETSTIEKQPTEDVLLKKLEELERKLKEKEAEVKPKPTPIQQSVQPDITPPKKRYHTVTEGDTLPKLAEKYYGNSSQWKKIYEANKEKIIRGQLVPGSILEIP